MALTRSENYLNPTEDFKATYGGTSMYRTLGGDSGLSDAISTNNDGYIGAYLSAVMNADKLGSMAQFKEDYKTNFLSNNERLSAAVNELYGDRETLNTYTRYVTDEDGNYVLNEAGDAYETEEYEDTEYNYTKEALLSRATVAEQEWEAEKAQAAKDSMNGWAKAGLAIASFLMNLAATVVDTIKDGCAFIALGMLSAFEPGILREYMAKEGNFSVWGAGCFSDWCAEFDTKYTILRDVNGNVTTWGNILYGVANTFGEMIPTALLNLATGGIYSAAATGSKIVQAGAKMLHGLVNATYWFNLGVSNVRDYVKTSPNASMTQICLTAFGVAAAQAAVTYANAYVFGGTILEQLTFGMNSSGGLYGGLLGAIRQNSFMNTGIMRFLEDAVIEGTKQWYEEEWQEACQAIIEHFSSYMNDNFVQTFYLSGDQFLNAMAMSYLTSALSIGFNYSRVLVNRMDNIASPKLKETVDAEGNVVQDIQYKNLRANMLDKNGNIKDSVDQSRLKVKYNKLSLRETMDFQYAYSRMTAEAQALNKMLSNRSMDAKVKTESGEKDYRYNQYEKWSSKESAEFNRHMTMLTNMANTVAQVYGAMGDTQFHEAMDMLNNIKEHTEKQNYIVEYGGYVKYVKDMIQSVAIHREMDGLDGLAGKLAVNRVNDVLLMFDPEYWHSLQATDANITEEEAAAREAQEMNDAVAPKEATAQTKETAETLDSDEYTIDENGNLVDRQGHIMVDKEGNVTEEGKQADLKPAQEAEATVEQPEVSQHVTDQFAQDEETLNKDIDARHEAYTKMRDEHNSQYTDARNAYTAVVNTYNQTVKDYNESHNKYTDYTNDTVYQNALTDWNNRQSYANKMYNLIDNNKQNIVKYQGMIEQLQTEIAVTKKELSIRPDLQETLNSQEERMTFLQESIKEMQEDNKRIQDSIDEQLQKVNDNPAIAKAQEYLEDSLHKCVAMAAAKAPIADARSTFQEVNNQYTNTYNEYTQAVEQELRSRIHLMTEQTMSTLHPELVQNEVDAEADFNKWDGNVMQAETRLGIMQQRLNDAVAQRMQNVQNLDTDLGSAQANILFNRVTKFEHRRDVLMEQFENAPADSPKLERISNSLKSVLDQIDQLYDMIFNTAPNLSESTQFINQLQEDTEIQESITNKYRARREDAVKALDQARIDLDNEGKVVNNAVKTHAKVLLKSAQSTRNQIQKNLNKVVKQKGIIEKKVNSLQKQLDSLMAKAAKTNTDISKTTRVKELQTQLTELRETSKSISERVDAMLGSLESAQEEVDVYNYMVKSIDRLIEEARKDARFQETPHVDEQETVDMGEGDATEQATIVPDNANVNEQAEQVTPVENEQIEYAQVEGESTVEPIDTTQAEDEFTSEELEEMDNENEIVNEDGSVELEVPIEDLLQKTPDKLPMYTMRDKGAQRFRANYGNAEEMDRILVGERADTGSGIVKPASAFTDLTEKQLIEGQEFNLTGQDFLDPETGEVLGHQGEIAASINSRSSSSLHNTVEYKVTPEMRQKVKDVKELTSDDAIILISNSGRDVTIQHYTNRNTGKKNIIVGIPKFLAEDNTKAAPILLKQGVQIDILSYLASSKVYAPLYRKLNDIFEVAYGQIKAPNDVGKFAEYTSFDKAISAIANLLYNPQFTELALYAYGDEVLQYIAKLPDMFNEVSQLYIEDSDPMQMLYSAAAEEVRDNIKNTIKYVALNNGTQALRTKLVTLNLFTRDELIELTRAYKNPATAEQGWAEAESSFTDLREFFSDTLHKSLLFNELSFQYIGNSIDTAEELNYYGYYAALCVKTLIDNYQTIAQNNMYSQQHQTLPIKEDAQVLYNYFDEIRKLTPVNLSKADDIIEKYASKGYSIKRLMHDWALIMENQEALSVISDAIPTMSRYISMETKNGTKIKVPTKWQNKRFDFTAKSPARSGTYVKARSIGDMVFNNWLRDNGLTADALYDFVANGNGFALPYRMVEFYTKKMQVMSQEEFSKYTNAWYSLERKDTSTYDFGLDTWMKLAKAISMSFENRTSFKYTAQIDPDATWFSKFIITRQDDNTNYSTRTTKTNANIHDQIYLDVPPESKVYNEIMRKIVNPNLPPDVATYLTMADIISNPKAYINPMLLLSMNDSYVLDDYLDVRNHNDSSSPMPEDAQVQEAVRQEHQKSTTEVYIDKNTGHTLTPNYAINPGTVNTLAFLQDLLLREYHVDLIYENGQINMVDMEPIINNFTDTIIKNTPNLYTPDGQLNTDTAFIPISTFTSVMKEEVNHSSKKFEDARYRIPMSTFIKEDAAFYNAVKDVPVYLVVYSEDRLLQFEFGGNGGQYVPSRNCIEIPYLIEEGTSITDCALELSTFYHELSHAIRFNTIALNAGYLNRSVGFWQTLFSQDTIMPESADYNRRTAIQMILDLAGDGYIDASFVNEMFDPYRTKIDFGFGPDNTEFDGYMDVGESVSTFISNHEEYDETFNTRNGLGELSFDASNIDMTGDALYTALAEISYLSDPIEYTAFNNPTAPTYTTYFERDSHLPDHRGLFTMSFSNGKSYTFVVPTNLAISKAAILGRRTNISLGADDSIATAFNGQNRQVKAYMDEAVTKNIAGINETGDVQSLQRLNKTLSTYRSGMDTASTSTEVTSLIRDKLNSKDVTGVTRQIYQAINYMMTAKDRRGADVSGDYSTANKISGLTQGDNALTADDINFVLRSPSVYKTIHQYMYSVLVGDNNPSITYNQFLNMPVTYFIASQDGQMKTRFPGVLISIDNTASTDKIVNTQFNNDPSRPKYGKLAIGNIRMSNVLFMNDSGIAWLDIGDLDTATNEFKNVLSSDMIDIANTEVTPANAKPKQISITENRTKTTSKKPRTFNTYKADGQATPTSFKRFQQQGIYVNTLRNITSDQLVFDFASDTVYILVKNKQSYNIIAESITENSHLMLRSEFNKLATTGENINFNVTDENRDSIYDSAENLLNNPKIPIVTKEKVKQALAAAGYTLDAINSNITTMDKCNVVMKSGKTVAMPTFEKDGKAIVVKDYMMSDEPTYPASDINYIKVPELVNDADTNAQRNTITQEQIDQGTQDIMNEEQEQESQQDADKIDIPANTQAPSRVTGNMIRAENIVNQYMSMSTPDFCNAISHMTETEFSNVRAAFDIYLYKNMQMTQDPSTAVMMQARIKALMNATNAYRIGNYVNTIVPDHEIMSFYQTQSDQIEHAIGSGEYSNDNIMHEYFAHKSTNDANAFVMYLRQLSFGDLQRLRYQLEQADIAHDYLDYRTKNDDNHSIDLYMSDIATLNHIVDNDIAAITDVMLRVAADDTLIPRASQLTQYREKYQYDEASVTNLMNFLVLSHSDKVAIAQATDTEGLTRLRDRVITYLDMKFRGINTVLADDMLSVLNGELVKRNPPDISNVTKTATEVGRVTNQTKTDPDNFRNKIHYSDENREAWVNLFAGKSFCEGIAPTNRALRFKQEDLILSTVLNSNKSSWGNADRLIMAANNTRDAFLAQIPESRMSYDQLMQLEEAKGSAYYAYELTDPDITNPVGYAPIFEALIQRGDMVGMNGGILNRLWEKTYTLLHNGSTDGMNNVVDYKAYLTLNNAVNQMLQQDDINTQIYTQLLKPLVKAVAAYQAYIVSFRMHDDTLASLGLNNKLLADIYSIASMPRFYLYDYICNNISINDFAMYKSIINDAIAKIDARISPNDEFIDALETVETVMNDIMRNKDAQKYKNVTEMKPQQTGINEIYTEAIDTMRTRDLSHIVAQVDSDAQPIEKLDARLPSRSERTWRNTEGLTTDRVKIAGTDQIYMLDTLRVSKQKAQGTNLADPRLGFQRPNRQLALSLPMQAFIVSSNFDTSKGPAISKDVRDAIIIANTEPKIYNASRGISLFNRSDIIRIIKEFSSDQINDYTFEQIRKYFFPTQTSIHSMTELNGLTGSIDQIWALTKTIEHYAKGKDIDNALLNQGIDFDMDAPIDLTKVWNAITELERTDNTAHDVYAEYLKRAQYINGTERKISDADINIALMNKYTGSLRSLQNVYNSEIWASRQAYNAKEGKSYKPVRGRTNEVGDIQFDNDVSGLESQYGESITMAETTPISELLEESILSSFDYEDVSNLNTRQQEELELIRIMAERILLEDYSDLNSQELTEELSTMPMESRDYLIQQATKAVRSMTPEQKAEAFAKYQNGIGDVYDIFDDIDTTDTKSDAQRRLEALTEFNRESMRNTCKNILEKKMRYTWSMKTLAKIRSIYTEEYCEEHGWPYLFEHTRNVELKSYAELVSGKHVTDLQPIWEELTDIQSKYNDGKFGTTREQQAVRKANAEAHKRAVLEGQLQEEQESNLNLVRENIRLQGTVDEVRRNLAQKEQQLEDAGVEYEKIQKRLNVAQEFNMILSKGQAATVPKTLVKILNSTTDDIGIRMSTVKNVNATNANIKYNYEAFFDANAKTLSIMSAEDWLEILDYAENGQPIYASNDLNTERMYYEYIMYLLQYLNRQVQKNNIVLDQSDADRVAFQVERYSNLAGSVLFAKKSSDAALYPLKSIAKQQFKDSGLDYTEEELEQLSRVLDLQPGSTKNKNSKNSRNLDVQNNTYTERIPKTKEGESEEEEAEVGSVLTKDVGDTVTRAYLEALGIQKQYLDRLFKNSDTLYITKENKAELVGIVVSNISAAKLRDIQIRNGTGHKLDKIYAWEQMCMLSWPGTWARNVSSNLVLIATNHIADAMGSWFGKGKATEKRLMAIQDYVDQKNAKQNKQLDYFMYKIYGTKVSSEMKTAVHDMLNETMMIDPDHPSKSYTFWQMLSDAATKYTTMQNTVKGQSASEGDVLTALITDSISKRILNKNRFKGTIVDENGNVIKDATKIQAGLDWLSNQLFRVMSDDAFIKKTTTYMFERMLTERGITPDQLNIHNRDVLNIFAEAYTEAAWQYMHKASPMHAFDEAMKQKVGKAGWFVWKQLMPFANATWNWGMEALNYSPVGLARGIYQLCKLDKNYIKNDQKLDMGETVPSGNLMLYNARKMIGKGITGTLLMMMGMMAAGFGIIALDKKDDKIKLHFGDNVYIDVSGLFGTSSFLAGAGFVYTLMNNDESVSNKIWAATSSLLDSILDDSIFNDFLQSFEYSTTIGDWVEYNLINAVSMFVPNLWKNIVNSTYDFEIQYDSGLVGSLEKLGVKMLPGLAYAMPRKYDVYTGEVKSTYRIPFLYKIANSLSPVDIEVYSTSEYQVIAESLGLSKGLLTGQYEDIGTLTTRQKVQLNQMYGRLNAQSLNDLMNNKTSVRVQNDDGSYSELKWRKMTDKQKAAAINNLMSKNATYSKIYVYTSVMGGKYYASEDELVVLRRLGITKNVYLENSKYSGFV